MIIDAHSHLFDKLFDSDREKVITRMKAAGVSTITVGTDYAESVRAIEIAEEYSDEKYDMWATVGLHPSDNPEEHFDISTFRNLALNPKVVGIGETGLDYYWGKTEEDRVRQKKLFEQHIELAREVSKPLMIHCREAYEDLLPMIPDDVKAHFHFFSSDWSIAQKCLDRGFTLSFPGTITFTHQYDEVVKNVPSDCFTVETDAPYVAPAPYRGRRNEPIYVLETIKRVAEIRGITPERVAELTTATSKRVFAIP